MASIVDAIPPSEQQSSAKPKGGVYQINHPLVQRHITWMRNEETRPSSFRHSVRRLAVLMAYEATKDLPIEPVEVQTPVAMAEGVKIQGRIGLVPILRAGLGMVDPVLDLLPMAEVWHLGLYRDEATAQPVTYYDKLPNERPVDVALVTDPMLATGGSVTAALTALREWGVPHVKVLSLIASQEGVDMVAEQFPEAQIYVCKIDPVLNDQKFIVPGLGDAGDRIFNTVDPT
ncbi:uracil phosphoribosyltransferase [Adhaeretor mobilis]|uniref:Uracil phosphoribosyltransferase n=1 Tax=Adhaeretor mobilis TaxID=1930276 RepID=A0A517MUW5_9BACT|nr:uracil phosphoribosyltransferase [Adhaeretor mobilis]QDS98673.1 Uracil phosphoribosyltransferase [Adhaeretor mobilis]